MGESTSTGTVVGAVTVSGEHLPECAPRISNWGEDCICKYLGACEKRMLDTIQERILRLPYEIDGEIWIDRDQVIGWIDSLRGERK